MRSSTKIAKLATLLIFSLVAAEPNFQLIDCSGIPIVLPGLGLLLCDGGTVCDDGFSMNSANAICKEIGFDLAKSWGADQNWRTLQNGFPIGLDDVVCFTPSWSSCTYTTSHDCGHSEDIYLTCGCSGSVLCPPGQYHGYMCTCSHCPSDSYQPTAGPQTSCTPCPGTTTATPGSSYCSCNAGMFWNETVSQCESCAQGFVSQEGSLQCMACPSGSNITNQSTSCSCPDGMEWSWTDQQGSCKPCLSGTYKNANKTSCTICPPGTSSQVGSNHCICSVGSYWNGAACQDCLEGTVSQKGASQCLSCPIRWEALGAGSCACPGGMTWMWDESGHGSCEPCLQGTYKSDQMESCYSCPLGTMSTLGSDHCSCRGGMFWNETSCQNCSDGMTSHAGAFECVSCPKGSIVLAGGAACSCLEGEKWDWVEYSNGSCKSCQPGSFKSDSMAFCQTCPPDSTSNAGSGHCLCSAGKFWNYTRCDGCAKGSVSPPGALQCLLCPHSSHPDTEKTICSCPFGKSWSWNDDGEGFCSLIPLSLILGLVLISTSGFLALLSLTLGIVLVSQKLNRGKDDKSAATVAYVVEGDVEINQRSGMECSGEDLIVSQPGQEVGCGAETLFCGADDNIYNSLIKQ